MTPTGPNERAREHVDVLKALRKRYVTGMPTLLPVPEIIAALDGAIAQAISPAPAAVAGGDAEEDAYVIDALAHLLAEISIIVNGPEPAGTKWSYHDLPAKVRALAALLTLLENNSDR